MRRKITGTLFSVVTAVALSVGVSVPTLADDLNDKKKNLEQQVDAANQGLDEKTASLDEVTKKVQESRQQLADAKAKLAKANSERDSAVAEEKRLADEQAKAEKELEAANTSVKNGKAAIEEQRSKAVTQMQMNAQQNTDLLSVAIFFTADKGTADINQRVQWAQTAYNKNSSEINRLTTLQIQLQKDQENKAELENQAKTARDQAKAQVAVAEEAKNAAASAQETVQKTVTANEEAEKSAQQAVENQKQARDVKQAELDQVLSDIKARNAKLDTSKKVAPSGNRNTGGTLAMPAYGPYTSPFGPRINPVLGYSEFHDGLDIGAGCGTPIYAAESGTVAKVGWVRGYGWQAIVDHGIINGVPMSTGYNHAQGYSVKPGQHVERGQQIGTIGTTGLSTGCHLHFHVFVNGKPANPELYL